MQLTYVYILHIYRYVYIYTYDWHIHTVTCLPKYFCPPHSFIACGHVGTSHSFCIWGTVRRSNRASCWGQYPKRRLTCDDDSVTWLSVKLEWTEHNRSNVRLIQKSKYMFMLYKVTANPLSSNKGLSGLKIRKKWKYTWSGKANTLEKMRIGWRIQVKTQAHVFDLLKLSKAAGHLALQEIWRETISDSIGENIETYWDLVKERFQSLPAPSVAPGPHQSHPRRLCQQTEEWHQSRCSKCSFCQPHFTESSRVVTDPLQCITQSSTLKYLSWNLLLTSALLNFARRASTSNLGHGNQIFKHCKHSTASSVRCICIFTFSSADTT